MQKKPISAFVVLHMLLILVIGFFPSFSFSQHSFFDDDKAQETELNFPHISGFYTNASHVDSIFFSDFQPGWHAELQIYNAASGVTTIHYPVENDYVLSKDICEDCLFKRVLWTYTPSSYVEAGSCQIQMGCPEAVNYLALGSSVCRITALIDGFMFFSTGVLVNNTANDGRPLLLTAEHNGLNFFNNSFSNDQELAQWLFIFNLESSVCNGFSIPTNMVVYEGAGLLSRSFDRGGTTGSDFALLEINDSTFNASDHFFAGWTRSTTAPQNGTCIHHPGGAFKRISFYSNTPQLSVYDQQTTPMHWRVIWSPSTSGHGTTEPGSSGSPLFDQNNRITGILSGGFSSCEQLLSPDFYGVFYHQWDQNGSDSTQQLAPWLDPLGLNPMHIDEYHLDTSKITEIPPRFHIFPNPVSVGSRIFIDGVYNSADLYNLNGQKIWENRSQLTAPNVQGIYILIINRHDIKTTHKLFVY